MFYALVKKGRDISESLAKFIALAPCTVISREQVPADYKTTFFKLHDIGVYAMFGPNWLDDLNNKICK